MLFHSRGECIILLLTANPFAVVGFFRCLCLVVEIELVEAIGKGQKHQTVDEKEFENIQQHATKRDLQWAQVRVGSEQRDETQGAEDVGNRK